MKIETYQDLIDQITIWLNRDDSSTIDAIPSFIRAAELDIKRLVQFKENIVTDEVTVMNGSVDKPEDLHVLVEVYSEDGETGTEVTHREVLRQKKLGNSNDSFIFSEVNNKYVFHNVEDGTLLYLRYYKTPEHLSFANSKSTLLAKAPDLLLYTALSHGSLFAEDNEKAPQWDERSQNALRELISEMDEQDMSGSALVIPQRYNSFY